MFINPLLKTNCDKWRDGVGYLSVWGKEKPR